MGRLFLILLVQFLLRNQMSFGQTIIRSSLGCYGYTYSESGFILRQTAGQASGTYVLMNDAMVLRQGFQQPLVQKMYTRNIQPLDFKISPNPGKDMIKLTFHEEIPSCIIYIRDLYGSPLIETREEYIYSKWLDLNYLKPGVYIVTVVCNNTSGSKELIITK